MEMKCLSMLNKGIRMKTSDSLFNAIHKWSRRCSTHIEHVRFFANQISIKDDLFFFIFLEMKRVPRKLSFLKQHQFRRRCNDDDDFFFLTDEQTKQNLDFFLFSQIRVN